MVDGFFITSTQLVDAPDRHSTRWRLVVPVIMMSCTFFKMETFAVSEYHEYFGV
jgi:hypothetical protein